MPELHTITKGENLTVIAEKFGFLSNWQAIYYDPSNADFRKKRKNPMLVYPGDQVFIPAAVCKGYVAYTFQTNIYEVSVDDDDLIRKALRLHGKYVELRESYMVWTSEPERASWRMIAEWTAALSEQQPDDFGSRVNQPELAKFRDADRAQIQQQVTIYESKCRELIDLMNLTSFHKQFDALTPDEQDEVYSLLTERLFESEVGRTYLAAALLKDDSALYKTVFKTTRKANTAFWRTLGAFSPMIVLQKKSEALEYIEKLIHRKTAIDIPKLNIMRARWDIIPAGSIIAERVRQEIPILTFEMKDNLKGIKGVAAKTLDLVNVAFALYALQKKKDTREAINTIGAVTGLIDKFEKATLALAEFELAGLRLGAVYTKYARVAGPAGAFKLIPKLATKISILSLISGICETITGSIDAYDRSAKGDYNAAVAYGFVATGGLATAIGAGMMIFGGSTAWTGIGAIVLVAGAMVSLIATIASWFLTDSPLQDWIRNNRFGKHVQFSMPMFGSIKDALKEAQQRKLDYKTQLTELKKIITVVAFEKDFSVGHHIITIKPTMVLPCSRVTIDIDYFTSDVFGFTFGTGCYMRNRVIDERFVTKRDDQRITEIEIQVFDNFDKPVLYDKVVIWMRVDVYNDGQFLYDTGEITLKPGLGARILSCF